MHSILFRIGPFPIYSYGFMLMLAFLAATAAAVRLARQRGIPPEASLGLLLPELLVDELDDLLDRLPGGR